MTLAQKEKRYALLIVLGIFIGIVISVICGGTDSVLAAKKTVAKKEYYVVSRMEGEVVILENEKGEETQVERKKFPKRIKEEDVVYYRNGKYRKDSRKTRERKKAIEAEMKNFFTS